MREALRVLRDLYSARHYCRSFVPRVRISSPPPSPAYFHRLSLSPFFFLSLPPFCSSSSFFFLFLLLPPFTALLHSRLLCYRHNARQWGSRGTIADSVSSEISEWLIWRYAFRLPYPLSASLRAFHSFEQRFYLHAKLSFSSVPILSRREIVWSIIIESLIIVLVTYSSTSFSSTRGGISL